MKYALGILGFIGLSNAVAVAEPQPIADSADNVYELVNGYTSVDAQSSHSASHNQYNTGYTSIESLHSQYSSHYAYTTGFTSIDRSSPGPTGVTQNSPAQTGGSTDDGSDDGSNALPKDSSGSPQASTSTRIALQVKIRRGSSRRQVSKPNLLTHDSTTSRDCNVATFYLLDSASRLMEESGRLISASGGPNAQNQIFTSKATGDITTGFALGAGVLTWRNPAFVNGFAYFCQVPAGQVFAVVRTPAPDGCVNVTLDSFAAAACPRSVSATSLKSSTSSAESTSRSGQLESAPSSTAATTSAQSPSASDKSVTSSTSSSASDSFSENLKPGSSSTSSSTTTLSGTSSSATTTVPSSRFTTTGSTASATTSMSADSMTSSSLSSVSRVTVSSTPVVSASSTTRVSPSSTQSTSANSTTRVSPSSTASTSANSTTRVSPSSTPSTSANSMTSSKTSSTLIIRPSSTVSIPTNSTTSVRTSSVVSLTESASARANSTTGISTSSISTSSISANSTTTRSSVSASITPTPSSNSTSNSTTPCKTQTIIPLVSSVVSVNASNVVVTFDYVGCIDYNPTGQPVKGELHYNLTQTPERCANNAVQGNFSYMALSYGTNCDLGQRLDFAKGMSYLPSADCAHACSGDLTKACGAETIALVYSRNASQPVLIPDGSRAKTAPVTQQAVSKSGRWAYSGCRLGGFTSARETTNNATSAGCATTCDGYPQFALTFGNHCYCGTQDYTRVNYCEAQCNAACRFNRTEACGQDLYFASYNFIGP